MSKIKLVIKNIFFGAGTRLVILALGMVLPRLFIVSYGSEVNGLLATVTQIFTYLALLEAGIGNSAINALYRPLEEKNYSEANDVVCEAKNYYRKVSIVYAISILFFATVYPIFAKTTLSRGVVFGIILLQGGASFVNYYFTAVYTQLLIADGKKYINENITFISYVFSTIVKITFIFLGFNVIFVQVGHFVINVINVPVIKCICKKKYPWLNFKLPVIGGKLKERKAFIIHELSTTIFNNTDVFIISLFCSFELASVYTVYNLIFSSLTNLLATANSGLGFVLGQTQYKDRELLIETYNVYSCVYSYVVFVIFSVCAVLIVPFVKLYTSGVSDTNYLIVGLPILFTIISILSGMRATGSLLITVSGHADATKKRSLIEAFINIGASLILVNIFGIYGVLLGTIIALLYRANDIIIYANRKILQRNPLYEYKTIFVNSLVFIVIWISFKYIDLNINSYLSFVIHGIVITLAVAVIFLVATLLVNPSLVRSGKQLIKQRFSK